MLTFTTLRKRAEFLRLRRSRFYRTAGFVLRLERAPEALTPPLPETGCRVGYTVSRHVSKKAVVRNKVKRRLREIARECLPKYAQPGYDYVFIAQSEAPNMAFIQLKEDAIRALKRLRKPPHAKPSALPAHHDPA